MKVIFALLFFVCFTNLYLSASAAPIESPTTNDGDDSDTKNEIYSLLKGLLEEYFPIEGIIPSSDGIKSYLRTVIQAINNLIETLGNVTEKNVQESAKNLYGKLKDEKLVKTAVTAILNVYIGIKDNINNVTDSTRQRAAEIVTGIKNGVDELKEPAIQLADKVVGDIKRNIENIKEPTEEKVKNIVNDFQQKLSSYEDPAKKKIKELINDVSNVLKAILDGPLSEANNDLQTDLNVPI
ncbi:uncharacterized protein LOC122509105 [Leptopilina heterotoma]|uniref:uncharacterized protein LOC122509105 n=1 Tax=Leptopilina heterotoma TaxID=63436 RepID=UPI001CA907E9|nr:uncharacterized protein LOC122509105 [Leptopilina heterotoma]